MKRKHRLVRQNKFDHRTAFGRFFRFEIFTKPNDVALNLPK